jgi:hypothetical protein
VANPYKFLSNFGQAHLLHCISTLFGHDEALLQFFFSHKEPVLRLPAKCLIEEASKYPLKEQLLIRVALDFWNRRGAAKLSDMLSEWDHESWVKFLHSVALLEECTDPLVAALGGTTPKRRKRT